MEPQVLLNYNYKLFIIDTEKINEKIYKSSMLTVLLISTFLTDI